MIRSILLMASLTCMTASATPIAPQESTDAPAAHVQNAHATIQHRWPRWNQFRQAAVTPDGRVVDSSDPRLITTSEGQAYGMFLALVAGDADTFESLFEWTRNNLCGGNCSRQLPAWLWGKLEQPKARKDKRSDAPTWGVIDRNNAVDADMWIAFALLEAGRLWNRSDLNESGLAMLKLLRETCLAHLEGIGIVVLPGRTGFQYPDGALTLNPSYTPIQLLRRFALEDPFWAKVAEASLRTTLLASRNGIVPDWQVFDATGQPVGRRSSKGSWDAVRAYLWAGMLSPDDAYASALKSCFSQAIRSASLLRLPPAEAQADNGFMAPPGPAIFGAGFMALLQNERSGDYARTLVQHEPVGSDNYYRSMLSMFALGFDEGRFAFDRKGQLIFPKELR